MQNEPSKKALDAAYGFLARRSHSRAELKQKLDKKGFSPDDIAAAFNRLSGQGYLNDDEVALRWAHSLVKIKGWGRAKIAAYLMQKGMGKESIEQAQKQIWQEFSEEDTARRALKKRFLSSPKQPAPVKMAAFLKSRGFSSNVIYRVVSGLSDEEL